MAFSITPNVMHFQSLKCKFLILNFKMHKVYDISEISKTIKVLALISTHLFCFGCLYLVISSFAYMLIDRNSVKSCYFIPFYMYCQPYNKAWFMSRLDWIFENQLLSFPHSSLLFSFFSSFFFFFFLIFILFIHCNHLYFP